MLLFCKEERPERVSGSSATYWPPRWDWMKPGETKHRSQVSCMTHLASNWLNCSVESSRWGSAHMSIVPYQVAFPSLHSKYSFFSDLPHLRWLSNNWLR